MRVKKKIALLTLALVASMTVTSGYTMAETGNVREVNLVINHEEIETDVPPFILDGRTLAPLRVIAEELGCEVKYYESTRKVVVKNDTNVIEMTLDKNQVSVNGETQIVDVPPTSYNGRTMLPVRFLAEALGCQVTFVDADNTVYVIGDVEEKPEQKVDEFGRKIRTTNLPSNHEEFPYIVEGVPNWVYESIPKIWEDPVTVWKHHGENNAVLTPTDLFNNTNPTERHDFSYEHTYEMLDVMLNNMLNLDYRTIDAKDYAEINKMYTAESSMKPEMYQYSLDHVAWLKEQKVISSAEVHVLPETFWKGRYDSFYGQAWVKLVVDQVPQDPSMNYDTIASMMGESNYTPLEQGVVYEGVVTIRLYENRTGDAVESIQMPHLMDLGTLSPEIQLGPDNFYGLAK